MARREYRGFCDKYGKDKVVLAGYSAPVIGLFFHMPITAISGIVCTLVASYAHGWGNAVASKKKLNSEKGGKLVRKFQASAYALTVAAAMALDVALDTKDLYQEQPQQEKDKIVQVVKPQGLGVH